MITKEQLLDELQQIEFLNDITVDTTVETSKIIEKCNKASWNLTTFSNKHELNALQNIVGMSTIANAKIINLICKSLSENETYVNIGTFQGFSLIAGLIDTTCKVEGIDNFSQFSGPKDIFLKNYDQYKRDNSKFFDQDYVEYLQNKTEPIQFYFYDGPHKYRDQYNAIKLANHLLYKGSIVMVDDTNANGVKEGTFDALRDLNRNYNIWIDLRTAHNKHPTFWNGILILELL